MARNLSAGKRGLYLSLALSLGSLAVIFVLTADENTWESVLSVRPAVLAMASIMVVTLWCVEGLRIKMIAMALSNGEELRLREAVRIYLVTFFFAGITPLAIGEWPAQIYTLCKNGLTAGESAAVSMVRMFLTKCVFVSLAAFLLFIDGRAARGSGLMFSLFRYAFWALTVTTSVYLLALWRSGFAQAVLERLQRLRRFQSIYHNKPKVRGYFDKVVQEASQFQETARQINVKNGYTLILPLLLTVVFWSIFFFIAPVILTGFGLATDVRLAITRQVMIMLVLPYVPVPGGSGVAEFGLVTLFAAFVPSHMLGVFIIVWRFFTYYFTLIFGGISALGVGGRRC